MSSVVTRDYTILDTQSTLTNTAEAARKDRTISCHLNITVAARKMADDYGSITNRSDLRAMVRLLLA